MIQLRPATAQDFDAIVALFAAGAELFRDDTTAEELLQWLTSPRLDIERDSRLAYEDGSIVGYVDVDPLGEDPVRWWCDVRIHPDAEVAHVVPPLLDWAERRAGSGLVRVWGPSTFEALRREFEAAGYRRIRGSYRMQIELDESPREPRFPDGVEVRTLRPGEERVAYEVHSETFADSWEHTTEPYEEWEHYAVKTEAFDPSLWFIAWDGDEPAGIALCRVRNGIGFVGILGVRRAWRRRGLGRALLEHAFAAFAQRGFDKVALGVDAESLTGAHRLYEAAGMRVVRQLDFFEKQLPSSA